jgi:hypothetical protein
MARAVLPADHWVLAARGRAFTSRRTVLAYLLNHRASTRNRTSGADIRCADRQFHGDATREETATMPAQYRDSKIPLIPAMTAQSGIYVHANEHGGDWSYAYDIQAAGTKSERRIGKLQAHGLEGVIATARPGDSIETPWGVMLRTPDTLYERGFLLEHTQGEPIETSAEALLTVPENLLMRGGRWTAQIGPWRYTVRGTAMETRSERRIGRLYFGQNEVLGAKQGDYIDTPWGQLRWMGLVNFVNMTDYEQGFLLRGTQDRPLDLAGNAIFPNSAGVTVRLESLYLDAGFRVAADARPAHTVSLLLSGRPDRDVEMTGSLLLDPNQCSLNDFGDREGCSRMAVRAVDVNVTRQRLGDPKHLQRKFFSVRSDELPQVLTLVVQDRLERCYLKLDRQVVPLYVDDGV